MLAGAAILVNSVFCSPVHRVQNPKSSTMSEREDNVYKAKLAEQAERYDGTF